MSVSKAYEQTFRGMRCDSVQDTDMEMLINETENETHQNDGRNDKTCSQL